MKGVEPLIAAIFIILISVAGIVVVLESSQPSVDRLKEISLFEESKKILTQIDNAVKAVTEEGEGSTRVLQFSVSGGNYIIDTNKDAVVFSMDSRSQIVGVGISKSEGSINMLGESNEVLLNISYSNINVTGGGSFGKGYHSLIIRNNGYDPVSGKQIVSISTEVIITPITTFTFQYNQSQTFVLKGTSTSSTNNLNDLGINYYVISEGLESGGQHDYFQKSTRNITGFNTTSADYTGSLDSQNYNVTSTRGQSGGMTVKQYNQTQTLVMEGTNTTSPSNLNIADSQTYNITESGTTTTQSDTSPDLESGVVQSEGGVASWTRTSTNYQNPTQNLAIGTGWTNPTRAYTSDNLYAQGASSVNHSYYGFGFALPLDAEVLGIWTRLDANASTATGVQQIRVEISRDSGVTWSNTGDATGDMGTAESTYTFGGDTDLWGLTWTPTNINNNFRVRITAATSSSSRYDRLDWLRANISYRNPIYDTESNETLTAYNNVYPDSVLDTVSNISVMVNVDAYSNAASNGKNLNPDLWLEVWDGNIWTEIGDMGITGTGNFVKIVPNQNNIYNWWQANPTQRNIRIKGRYFDANRTAWDEINYTDISVKIDSRRTTYRAEVEHNTTGVIWSGTLKSINVTLNFSTNVTSDFDLMIYNFYSGIWNYTSCQSGVATAGIWYRRWCNITDNPSYYNSSDNKIRVRLNGTSHANLAVVREDYIQYYIENSTSTSYANISVEHNSSAISENPSLITKINVTTILKTNISSGIPFNFYIYNFSSSAWELCSQALVNNIYSKIECVRTSYPSDYVSNDRIRVRLNSSGGTTTHQMMEDYLVYQISMPTEYRMEVEHNATGVSFTGSLDNISVSLNMSTSSADFPTFNFLIYNFNFGTWESCGAPFNPTVNIWYTIWCNRTSGSGDYLGGSIIRVRLNETAHSNQADVREDYVQYYVTYTG